MALGSSLVTMQQASLNCALPVELAFDREVHMQGNGRMQQLPGQATEGSASLVSSAESAVPQSWVAMRSDEGEAMHRLRHDEGSPVSLAGGLLAPLWLHLTPCQRQQHVWHCLRPMKRLWQSCCVPVLTWGRRKAEGWHRSDHRKWPLEPV